MIQGRRPATEDRQVVLRLHDPFAAGVTAGMTGNHAGAGHHLDPIDVRLDRHGLEGPAPRNTVAVGVEPHRLVLVHLGRLRDERIEGTRRQSQRRLLVLLEQLPDRSASCLPSRGPAWPGRTTAGTHSTRPGPASGEPESPSPAGDRTRCAPRRASRCPAPACRTADQSSSGSPRPRTAPAPSAGGPAGSP